MADIESLLKEKRVFEPPPAFAKQRELEQEGRRGVPQARRAQSRALLGADGEASTSPGSRPGRRCSTGSRRSRSGSSAARLNVSYNCLDRHLEGEHAWRRNKAAIIWEGEPGDTRVLTYGELHREVCRFANVLKALGVAEGRPRRDLHAAWSPSWRSRCSPARASARRTASSSAASRPRRCATASTTPARSSWSPPTAATGAARRSRSSPPSTRRSKACPGVENVDRACSAPAQDVAMKRGPRRLVARR